MDAEHLALSSALLQSVLSGMTYEEVARLNGMSRTAVERRVKALVLELVRTVGIDGLNESRAKFVRTMRAHREAIEVARARYEPRQHAGRAAETLVLSDEDIRSVMRRVQAGTLMPERDVAMVWILLATGLRPLEVARLQVGDYLDLDGSVRVESVVRAAVAVNGRARALYFTSPAACLAIDAYLAKRAKQAQGRGVRVDENLVTYRGLDPRAGLFLTDAGMAFHVSVVSAGGGTQWLCREIHYAYRKIFRRIGIPGLSAQSVRNTVVARLWRRGADRRQIGELLGVRGLKLPSTARQALSQLMERLV